MRTSSALSSRSTLRVRRLRANLSRKPFVFSFLIVWLIVFLLIQQSGVVEYSQLPLLYQWVQTNEEVIKDKKPQHLQHQALQVRLLGLLRKKDQARETQ